MDNGSSHFSCVQAEMEALKAELDVTESKAIIVVDYPVARGAVSPDVV